VKELGGPGLGVSNRAAGVPPAGRPARTRPNPRRTRDRPRRGGARPAAATAQGPGTSSPHVRARGVTPEVPQWSGSPAPTIELVDPNGLAAAAAAPSAGNGPVANATPSQDGHSLSEDSFRVLSLTQKYFALESLFAFICSVKPELFLVSSRLLL